MEEPLKAEDQFDLDAMNAIREDLSEEQEKVLDEMLSGDRMFGELARVEGGFAHILAYWHTGSAQTVGVPVDEFESEQSARELRGNSYWVDVDHDRNRASLEDLTRDERLDTIMNRYHIEASRRFERENGSDDRDGGSSRVSDDGLRIIDVTNNRSNPDDKEGLDDVGLDDLR